MHNPKPPLSQRIAAKLQAQRQQIAELQRQVDEQKRQTRQTEDRLHRVVDGRATRKPGTNIITMCIDVDTREANIHGTAIWEEATRAMIQSRRQELSRR